MKGKYDDYNKEREVFKRIERTFTRCCRCKNYGPVWKFQAGRQEKRVEVHKCIKHGCYNTERSYACKDYDEA